MCAVARRGLYKGWGFAELAEHGIAFGLAEMPRLAAMVADVTRQEAVRPRRSGITIMNVPAQPSEDPDAAVMVWERPLEAAAVGS